MKKTKRKQTILFALMSAAACLCVACGGGVKPGESSGGNTSLGDSGVNSSVSSGPNVPSGTEYSIRFVQEGQNDVVKKVPAGGTLTDVPTPVGAKGYTVIWDVSDFSNITEDLTVTAVSAANEYVVTYDADGGEVSSAEGSFTYDAAYTLLTPTKAGYEFVGWTCDYEYIDQTGTWTVDSNATLVAVWTPKTFKIIYNVGANEQASMTQAVQYVQFNEEYTLTPPQNNDLDFKFSHWVITGTSTKFEDGVYTLSNDVSLTAVWDYAYSGQH